MFGVGERMITACEPVVLAVCTSWRLWKRQDHLKIAGPQKPGQDHHLYLPAKTHRISDNATGKAEMDYITVGDEIRWTRAPHWEFRDLKATRKARSIFRNPLLQKALQVPAIQGVRAAYQLPALPEIQAYCRAQVDTLWSMAVA